MWEAGQTHSSLLFIQRIWGPHRDSLGETVTPGTWRRHLAASVEKGDSFLGVRLSQWPQNEAEILLTQASGSKDYGLTPVSASDSCVTSAKSASLPEPRFPRL